MRRTTALSLPPLAHDALAGLYAHRLLTTAQVGELFAPTMTPRWVRHTLARLRDVGVADRVGVAGGAEFAWFLTPAGVAATEGAGVEVRPYRITAQQAAGLLQAHTLATNEVGLVFVRAARARGDDCTPWAWRNETAHRIEGTGRKAETVISDAVLDYTLYEDGAPVRLTRFIEVDRGTKGVAALRAKLEAYTRLAAHQQRRWPRFPALLVVLCGQPPAQLERRLHALCDAARFSQELRMRSDVVVLATTLEELRTEGPWGPIFWPVVGGPEAHVDVRGREAAPVG